MKDHTIGGDETIAGGEGSLLTNRYRVVRQLGQGGMGSVWLVEDTLLDNKPFAVKMLPSILVANKRAYRQLKDEALVAMRLIHPNIVQIRAFEENNGNPFLVMDYIDGQTLDDYLAEHTGTTGVSPVAGGISEADVLRILTPIADALDYAHVEGVVHRDVKPANVMIRKDGHPFILDFGIAREIQETMTRVTGKLSSGTLLYMSPEQLMGDQPKPAQDVYSFAAMVYECLKGEPPFSHGQIEFQIMNKQPESPPGGTQLVASVMAGLAKKPETRPSSCGDVLFVRVRPVVPKTEPLPPWPQVAKGGGPTGGNASAAQRSIPREDWRSLPPDMRTHLEDRPSSSGGKEHDGCGGKRYDPSLWEGSRETEKPHAEYSWKPSVVMLVAVGVVIAVGCWLYQRQLHQDAEHEELIESQQTNWQQDLRKAKERQEQQARLACQKAEDERMAREREEQQARLARQKAEEERMAWEREEQQARLARQKAEEERKEMLRVEAEKPRVYLTATLNGVHKPALITDGMLENNKHRTPLTVDIQLPIGATGGFALEYYENGVKYVGKGGYTVKKGLQNMEIELSKVRDTFLRPKTINFCRHCRYSLRVYDEIGRDCPICGKNLWGN